MRPGEPRQLAAMCLLIARSTIQSGQIVAPILDADALDVELAHCAGRIPETMTGSTALNESRRAAELAALADGEPLDVIVIGGGITGTGIALDAASRGLRVALVEKHDLAFGTSRWSSKLVHGGLRYLATGNVGIARRSAIERGILMTRNAPHLVKAMPQLVPLLPEMNTASRALVRFGFAAGDGLRKLAGTPSSTLPRSRRIDAARAIELAPTVRRDGLSGGLLAYDGQLIDDARLVTAVARTAAQHGARILTRVGASNATGTSVTLTDQRSGESFDVSARAVINASGVWAGEVDTSIRLRPSRGTHLVFDAEDVRQSRRRADHSDSRRDQPVRVRDARTAGTRVPRADRRGRARTDSRCAATHVGGDLVPARHRQHRTGRRARSGRRHRRVCRTAAADRHSAADERSMGKRQPHGRRVA